jgi:hypothetical protein
MCEIEEALEVTLQLLRAQRGLIGGYAQETVVVGLRGSCGPTLGPFGGSGRALFSRSPTPAQGLPAQGRRSKGPGGLAERDATRGQSSQARIPSNVTSGHPLWADQGGEIKRVISVCSNWYGEAVGRCL